MALCHFCRRKFRSPQGVKSHLKRCSQYKAVKNQESSPLGSAPKGAATPAARPSFPSAQRSHSRISPHRWWIL